MSVLKIKELLEFTPSALKFYGKQISDAHKFQAQDGMDANGMPFSMYTPRYKKLKAAGKAAPNQSSTQTNPVNLELTGAMWKQWKLIGTKVGEELEITYGITDPDQGKKMHAHAKGRFGKPSKRSRITIRKDKKRVVAANQKVGPETEDAIVEAFVLNIAKNLRRLTNRPTIIRM